MSYEKLRQRILQLKDQKRAIILAHNYQRREIQEIADFTGDSLGLCRRAAETDAQYMVFCGVDFMAETASILNPDKKVLIPDTRATCPLANMLTARIIKDAKRKHKEGAVVLYVNTTAESKAEADIICTSSNAVEVVNALEQDVILFGPDWNLAQYVKNRTRKRIIPIPSYGYCPVHQYFTVNQIRELREIYPREELEVMVHPECSPIVQSSADFVGSTGKMLERPASLGKRIFIVGTEVGLIYPLYKRHKDKSFIPLCHDALCKPMKLHTLRKVYMALKKERPIVKVPKKIAAEARDSIEAMLKQKTAKKDTSFTIHDRTPFNTLS